MTQEDEVLGKAYDGRLMRRLLMYAMPNLGWIVLATVLTFMVTAASLAQPYLVKIAIDAHIDALTDPMVAYRIGQAPSGVPSTVWRGRVYVRTAALPTLPPASRLRYTIVVTKGQDYLVTGVPPQNAAARVRDGGHEVVVKGDTYPATPLTQADVQAFRAQDVRGLEEIGIFFLIALLITFVANYVQTYILQWVGQNAIFAIRKDVMEKIERMSIAFFDKNPVGRLVTRATNDVEQLEDLYTNVMVNFIQDALMLVGVIAIMLELDVRLTLLSLIVLPFVFFSAVLYRAKARVVYRQVRVALARINAFISENISGMKVIQSFHREDAQRAKFAKVNGAYREAGVRDVFLFSVFRPFMDFLYSGAVAGLVWFGGGKIIQGAVTFGVVYAFINYLQLLFQPINDITQKYSTMQQAMACSERIFLLIDRPVEVEDRPEALPLPKARGEVAFNHVTFAYEPGHDVLKDITFHVSPGETVAFVGATGAGKSSIMSLMTRFYDVQKGSITIDGIDIRDLKQSDVRKRIAIVHQEVFIFAGTIRQNIALNQTLSDEQVEAAARAVGAHEFIVRLPHGYDEPVQERGSTLSSGQRQLLSFARALAADPAVLILDEATANVDTETEEKIQRALHLLSAGRTMIIVAHRLSTVQHADRIIVMSHGRIHEAGSHQELLALRGLYHDLYQLQYALPDASADA